MSNTKDLRIKNSLKALREFMSGEEYTKNEIADKVQLTLVTASKIINKLLEGGVLLEQGTVDSDCGRKASIYTLNPNRFYICGLAIGLDFYHIEILNLMKETIYTHKAFLDGAQPFEDSIKMVCGQIHQAFGQLNISGENLLGIGVTVPGIVDSAKGKTVVLPNMPTWNHAPIKEVLEKEFHTMVILEKDNYASILYLKAVSGLRLNNAILMTIMGGVGCGILINGSIYQGENGLAGEIGHVSFGGSEEDTLENYASDLAIVNEIQRRRAAEGTGVPDKKTDIQSAIRDLKNGDIICQEVFQRAETHLGRALVALTRLYNPRYLFVDCLWVREMPKAFARLSGAVRNVNSLLPNCGVKLICIKEPDTIMKGASMLVYDYVTNHSTNNRLINDEKNE